MPTFSTPPLCIADDATFWPWRTWTEFARMTPEEKAGTTVMIPIAGFADWGIGHALDTEELMVTHVLKAAVQQRPANFHPLVLPPLRFVLGPDPACAFAVDPPTAHALLREVAIFINAAGFRRLVFVNASPWNEEFCASASRDLRIEFGLQIFRINFSMIDLDLHPTRSQTRRRVQTLVTALSGRAPDPAPEGLNAILGGVPSPRGNDASRGEGTPPTKATFWADERIRPLAGPAVSLESAAVEGAAILSATATRMAGLFGEIAAHPPLARHGALATMTAP
jgi:creatinine amidohydrolase